MGPPQGMMFIVPAPSAAVHASTRRSRPSRSYTGSRAGITIRNVDAPEPSRWESMVTTAVPATRRTGSPRQPRTTARITGENRPASFMTPK